MTHLIGNGKKHSEAMMSNQIAWEPTWRRAEALGLTLRDVLARAGRVGCYEAIAATQASCSELELKEMARVVSEEKRFVEAD